jgi:hypothetical protein
MQKSRGGKKMLARLTNKNNCRWSFDDLSLSRLIKLALLICLISLLGTQIGFTKEIKSNVQEKQQLDSGGVCKNLHFIEITDDKGQKVQLKGGDLLLITPKEDKVIDIVTDINKSIPGYTKILFSINKLAELSEKRHYLTVGLLFLKDKRSEVFFNVPPGSVSPGTLWPPNVNEKEESISISNDHTGSGYVYIFIIDSSNFSNVYSVTSDRVINSAILSNIIQQPLRFVKK